MARRRSKQMDPAYVVPYMLFMFGITTAPVCSILLLVFSALTWPPWGDSTIDGDLRKARGTVISTSAVERSRRGVSSWHLTTRIDAGPHKGRTARVFCNVRRGRGCPREGQTVDFEYCGHDLELARIPGERMTVLPVWATLLFSAVAVAGWGLLGAGAVTFLRARARRSSAGGVSPST